MRINFRGHKFSRGFIFANGKIQYTLFFIRIQFIRILRRRFDTNFFRKWGNIRALEKKGMLNETSSQEKEFKHIFGARAEWKITKNWPLI